MTTQNYSALASSIPALPDCNIGDWSSIDSMQQSGHDLGCIHRPVAFVTQDVVAGAKVGTARSEVDRGNAFEIASGLYASLGIKDFRLADDASALVAAFADAMPERSIQLRIDICDRTTCPKFHHDQRYMLLVTTYFGPTTEYMLEGHGEHIFHGALWELLLFKGGNHPSFSETVLHRSPPMLPGQRRLCVVIDC